MNEIEILKVENLICEAQLKSDWKILSSFLSIDLTYIHSNGYVDSYESYLEKIKNRILCYQSIEITTQKLKIQGNVAIKHSILKGVVRVVGHPKALNNHVTCMWLNESGKWKLEALQSTAIDEKLPS